uniref:Uncharacterized protein n=1 Tax=Arundo donax TaxID=35708 RepID=A0A0A9F6Y9_ARUDO
MAGTLCCFPYADRSQMTPTLRHRTPPQILFAAHIRRLQIPSSSTLLATTDTPPPSPRMLLPAAPSPPPRALSLLPLTREGRGDQAASGGVKWQGAGSEASPGADCHLGYRLYPKARRYPPA